MARNLKAGLDSIIQKSLGQDGKSTKLKMMRQFRAMLDGGTTPENWASFLEGISNARIIERAFPTPLVTASKPAVSDPPPPNTPVSYVQFFRDTTKLLTNTSQAVKSFCNLA